MIFQAVLNKKKPVLAWKIFCVCAPRVGRKQMVLFFVTQTKFLFWIDSVPR